MFRKNWIAVVRDSVPADASPDALDTLDQAAFVRRILDDLGMTALDVEFSEDVQDVTDSLKGLAPLAVFNLVESLAGETRLAPLAPVVYRKLRLPFTGSDESAQMLTGDKMVAKRILQAAGIPTPAGFSSGAPGAAGFSGPGEWIVKSRYEHASVGLDNDAVLHAASLIEVAEVMERMYASMGVCLAEEYIDGREFSVALLASPDGEVNILPVAEMHFNDFGTDPKILNYAAKWEQNSSACRNTVRSFALSSEDRELTDRMRDLALQCWETFGLSGYARVDFRVDDTCTPFVIDINPNPCIAEDSGFMAAAHAAGHTPGDVVKRILDASLRAARPVSCVVGKQGQHVSE